MEEGRVVEGGACAFGAFCWEARSGLAAARVKGAMEGRQWSRMTEIMCSSVYDIL